MTLRVPFDQFSDVARSWGVKQVFVEGRSGGATISATDPKATKIIASETEVAAANVKAQLQGDGFEVFAGSWLEGSTAQPYVAAVAYHSNEDIPGVWIDAYAEEPTPVKVLSRMYEEFRGTGEIHEIDFEEFVRLAKPNVVIVPPAEVMSWLDKTS